MSVLPPPFDRMSEKELTAAASTRARLDDALDHLRRPGRPSAAERLAEAERLHRARVDGEHQADDLTRHARERYHRDPITHTRAELAARVVEHYLGREAREAAIEGAAVALELVERDRDTAEAKLERVRALAAEWLTQGSPAPQAAARLLLDAIGDPA